MKKVIIHTKNQIREFTAEDPTDHLAICIGQNVWGLPDEYTIEIEDISAEFALKKCIESRIAEYPTPAEFMNAYFDGGEQALADLQVKRLAIKQKYPKP